MQTIDMRHQDENGLYLGEYTGDLSDGVMNEAWAESDSEWN